MYTTEIKMVIIIPSITTKKITQKYIVKEITRELKWYSRKHIYLTKKKAVMEGRN